MFLYLTSSSSIYTHSLLLGGAAFSKVHLENEAFNRSEGSCHIVCLHVTWAGFS